MPSPFILTVTDVLYLLCSVLLLVSAAAVLLRGPRSVLHQRYCLTALSLLGWVATLPLYYHSRSPVTVLWLGRVNFAAAALAVAFGYLLVRALAGDNQPSAPSRRSAFPLFSSAILAAEAILLALLSAFTPLIDRAEEIGTGPGARHITVYGPLFLAYALHVLGYLGASAIVAFRARREEPAGAVRDRLTLVGTGVLATGIVGVVTDIVLPYGMGDFRFTDLGPLSTALFLLAVGYAVLRHRLFDIRLLVRRTLVYGLLLSLAMAAYSAVILLVTDYLTKESANTLSRFAVLIIAFSIDPIRRLLEHRIDRLLFPREEPTYQSRKPRS